MKVCLVSQEYPPETAHGGIATQTHAKAHGLAALGHDVHVISHSTDGKRHEYRDGAAYVTRIPGFDAELPINTEPVRWLTYSALVAAEIDALHTRVGLDVIDFPEWGGEGFVHLLNRPDWDRAPAVAIHLHGPLIMLANTIGWPEKDSELFRIGTMMEGTCLRLADAVMSSSRCSADWCAKHYGLNGGTVPIIHSGIDTELFAPRSTPKAAELTILFVGRVASSKGVETLVDAACRLADTIRSLRLRIVGRVDERFATSLKAQAQNRGRERLLEIVGPMSHERLPEEMANAHVFAAPSRYEGGPGFVCLEAMACGLPVVACTGSGVAEVVDHGNTGLLVPPDDPVALASAVGTLLGDAALRATLGRQAREFAATEADSRVCVRRLESFYRQIIEASR